MLASAADGGNVTTHGMPVPMIADLVTEPTGLVLWPEKDFALYGSVHTRGAEIRAGELLKEIEKAKVTWEV